MARMWPWPSLTRWAHSMTAASLVLLTACGTPTASPPRTSTELEPTMSLWTLYLGCRNDAGLEMRKGTAIVLLERAKSSARAERLGRLRRSVDLQAMAASCGLLVGEALVKSGDLRDAKVVYRRIIEQPAVPDLESYKIAAHRALADIARERSR